MHYFSSCLCLSDVYFRKTGLERSGCISKDLEWLREQGNVIPQSSNPGVTYVQYLEELAEKSPPLFLCHFYNIYFSHIAGGQVIAKQVFRVLVRFILFIASQLVRYLSLHELYAIIY